MKPTAAARSDTVDSWKSSYSDDISAGPCTLERLFQRSVKEDTYNALRLILDKAPRFFQEFYSLVPDYKDGLSFVGFAFDVIKPYERKVPRERFMRWEICLITLKLEMMDKLGHWQEYRDYFDEMYDLHPDYQGKYAKTAMHLKVDRAHPYMISEDGDFYNVHFLYLLLPRYETINKYLKANKKVPIKRKPPDIDKQTIIRNYRLLAERLDMLLKLDGNIIKMYS